MKKTVFIMLLLLMVCCTTYAMASERILLEDFGVFAFVWIVLTIMGVK